VPIILHPLPDIAIHVIEAKSVGRFFAHRVKLPVRVPIRSPLFSDLY
jgi:hypothetical protein